MVVFFDFCYVPEFQMWLIGMILSLVQRMSQCNICYIMIRLFVWGRCHKLYKDVSFLYRYIRAFSIVIGSSEGTFPGVAVLYDSKNKGLERLTFVSHNNR